MSSMSTADLRELSARLIASSCDVTVHETLRIEDGAAGRAYKRCIAIAEERDNLRCRLSLECGDQSAAPDGWRYDTTGLLPARWTNGRGFIWRNPMPGDVHGTGWLAAPDAVTAPKFYHYVLDAMSALDQES